jgi:hypothetical protein
MGLIITKVFVLSSRYVVALAFVLMIPAAFQLGQLLTQYSQNKIQNKQLVVAIHLILIFMLGSVIKNVWPKAEGYNYMQDAVAWVKANNPNRKPVFYNEPRLIFYSGEKFNGKWSDNFNVLDSIIQNNKLNEFDYLVIDVNNKRRESEVLDEKISSFKKVFISTSNKSKKSVIIYERKKVMNKIKTYLLEYTGGKLDHRINLGDEIQSIAAKRILKNIDGYVSREGLNNITEPCIVSLNGFFLDSSNWPPSKSVIPIPFAFHVSKKYEKLICSARGIEYLKKYEPIGCRDLQSSNILKNMGLIPFTANA